MNDVEFPFLGTEPIAVEFANTAYGLGDDQVDFLGTAELIEGWFAQIPSEHGFSVPSTMGRHAGPVRALRDAVRAVLSAAAEQRMPESAAVNVVNGAAAAAPTFLRLDRDPDDPRATAPTARRVDTTPGSTAVLGRFATSCIDLVADPQGTVLRRCEGPGCSLLFVQHHRRRRFCHASCGHRDRQARYYRRHHTGGTP